MIDGTILKLKISLIKALRAYTFNPDGNPNYDLNTQTIIGIVSPINNWGRPSPPYTQEQLQLSIVDRDLKFEILQEPKNSYVLSDGTKVYITTMLQSASKTSKYSPNGEPIYIMNWHYSTQAEIPDSLNRKN